MFMAGPNSFWYPFDGYAFNFASQIVFHLEEDNKVIPSTAVLPEDFFIFSSDELNWDADITSKRMTSDSEHGNQLPLGYPYDQINVSVSRPFYLRIAYPVLIGFIILFIALLGTIDDTSIFIQASVGLLFGIFGIRELLEPPNTSVRTFLDVALILLYLLFALVLIQHVGNVLLKTHKENQKRKRNTLIVANRNSRVAHLITCRFVHTKSESQQARFMNIEDAIGKGYYPCKVCLLGESQNKKAA